MKNNLALIGCIALGLTGCAMYKIQPVSGEKLDHQWDSGTAHSGYVFYQPELYFLVTPTPAAPKAGETNAAVTYGVTPLFLPNPARPYRLTTFNFLAKSDFTFNFKDGWQLSSIADKADNTTLANTISGELQTLLNAGGLRAVPGQVAPPESETFLLHPNYDPAGVITGFSIVALPRHP